MQMFSILDVQCVRMHGTKTIDKKEKGVQHLTQKHLSELHIHSLRRWELPCIRWPMRAGIAEHMHHKK